MAGKIRVTPEELRTSSKVFKTNSNNTATMLKKLDSEVKKMESFWEGQANKQFIAQYDQLKPSMQKFVVLLDDIYKQLDGVAKTMEDVDREIANRLKR